MRYFERGTKETQAYVKIVHVSKYQVYHSVVTYAKYINEGVNCNSYLVLMAMAMFMVMMVIGRLVRGLIE